MVLLVLAVIWAAVLIPPMLRARAEARPADSIGHFRRQLHVLQRTAPSVLGATSAAPFPGRAVSVPSAAFRHVPPARAPHGYSPEAARRARTLKRRRDVLFTLLSAMGATLVLGLLPPLRALLGLHVVLDLLFVGYVALLIRARNAAAEREMKLRFLPATAPPDNVLLLRRSAN